MNSKRRIIIGTRGSKLSLVQTEIVTKLLHAQNPLLDIEIKIIKTTGDKNMNPIPLDSIGKGWFTREIDRALLKKTIDLAVHSLKDLSETLPPGLIISAVPQREDAREALVCTNGFTLKTLPKGAVIGTDSMRRKVQLLHKRNDIVVKSVRGNVNRRLQKLDDGEYDALLLAVAGLKRLGLEERITQYFSPTDFIPSPGQGALAIVTRTSDTFLTPLLKKITHKQTLTAITAERAFSAAIGGGCKLPVGAYCTWDNNALTLSGMVGSLDGNHIEKASLVGEISKPHTLGKLLAFKLLQNAPWYTKEHRQTA